MVEIEALDLIPRSPPDTVQVTTIYDPPPLDDDADDDARANTDRVRVVVRLTNRSGRALPFDVNRLAIARLDHAGRTRIRPVIPGPTPSATDSLPDPEDPEASETSVGDTLGDIATDVGVHIGTGVVALAAGSRVGVLIPRPRAEWAVTAVDMVTTVAVAAIVLPIQAVVFIDDELKRPPDHFEPGHTERFALDLGPLPIEGSDNFVLILGAALGLPAGAVAIPITDPTREHGGYHRPSQHAVVGARLGGGTARLAGTNTLAAEVQAYWAWKVHGLMIGPTLSIPIVSFGAGVQAAWSTRIGKRAKLDLSLAYEARNLFRDDLGWVHSPTLGFDLTWSTEDHTVLGWPVRTANIGLFARGGPVIQDGEVGVLWQAGLAFSY